MPKPISPKQQEYTFITIKLNSFVVRIDSSLNYKLRGTRPCCDEENVYAFESCCELDGIATYPDKRCGDQYKITVNGWEPDFGDFELKLKDCHVRDKSGELVYQNKRGKQIPVYDVPKGIGLIESAQKEKEWSGWVWVSPQTFTDMMALLLHIKPLYIEVQELREKRQRWIVGLSLQTNDPAAE